MSIISWLSSVGRQLFRNKNSRKLINDFGQILSRSGIYHALIDCKKTEIDIKSEYDLARFFIKENEKKIKKLFEKLKYVYYSQWSFEGKFQIEYIVDNHKITASFWDFSDIYINDGFAKKIGAIILAYRNDNLTLGTQDAHHKLLVQLNIKFDNIYEIKEVIL